MKKNKKEPNNSCMFKSLKIVTTLLFFVFLIPSLSAQPEERPALELWYNRPASVWTEALPVGNGSLGGMVFGGIAAEHLQMNEETVWTHGDDYQVRPDAYQYVQKVRALLFNGQYAEAQALAEAHILSPRMPSGTNTYQTLGDLSILSEIPDTVTGYRRSLNLQTGVAHVNYTADNISYNRTYFSSYPDQVMVIHLGASRPESINVDIFLSRPGNRAEITTGVDYIKMHEVVGDSSGVEMVTIAKILLPGGDLIHTKKGFSVSGADEVLIFITAATDYRGGNPELICQNRLENLRNISYNQLYNRHVTDYRNLFDRVKLGIGKTDKHNNPTDIRLREWQQHPEDDLALIPLYFQYGRYLLISCSRPGSLPANLQGLWCDGLNPPWNSDYHININLQMNYWPAEVTNLTECHLPFFDFADSLFVHGKETARTLYHARGFVAHHITDVWFPTVPVGRAVWGLWPLGGAWLTRQYWDYYLFTGDFDFLANRAYPAMKEASVFFTDYLVRNPNTGLYVSGPSSSPENTFITPGGNRASIAMGNAMDQEIITELFNQTIAAGRLLKRDRKWIKKLQSLKAELAPVKIGSDGRIMEWSSPFKEAEPGHRHMSHLYGLYPGDLFNWSQTPEFMRAAEKSLEYRLKNGGGHTGWSRAWIINFYARLGNGEAAWQHLKALIDKSTLSNLFDNHPPFQIDGNFGGTAGIAEMLIQSHTDTIRILPAIPGQWSSGSFSGLVARGGFVINLSWEDGFITEMEIISRLGNPCRLQYHGQMVSFDTSPGKSYFLNGDLEFLMPAPL
ncbi:MAG: glycoside hydrolase family 95 protein [Chlorobi bacterium]|nr:glycoside hydrolase family 95 protein [Chlorobiota bacterium]